MFINIEQQNVDAKLILNVGMLDKGFMYVDIKYVGVNQLLFLIKHLYLIKMWSCNDQRTNTLKTHVYKILHYFYRKYIYKKTTLHSFNSET